MEGISFIIKVRNEEATLEQCIRSLFPITIPHEIIVILHCCTDRSKEIAESLAKEHSTISIHEYSVEISKAGYETLATDVTSPHSLMTYYNWCIAKAKYVWKCKWDADFQMTPELLTYIHTNKELWKKHSQIIRLGAKNSTTVEMSDYFTSCKLYYLKHMFWEVPYYEFYKGQFEKYILKDIYIEHCSELKDVKPYWLRVPWYETEDSEEARLVKSRMEQLIKDFGSEPVGLARSMNPACEHIDQTIQRAKPSYVQFKK
jgi:glycosyltransferase involved in cell wall biosynthesis